MLFVSKTELTTQREGGQGQNLEPFHSGTGKNVKEISDDND